MRGALRASGGKCCKSLPLPPLPNGNPDEARDGGLLKVTPFFSTALVQKLAQIIGSEPAIAHTAETPCISAPPLHEALGFTVLPPFIALHRPASLTGRAPPVEN